MVYCASIEFYYIFALEVNIDDTIVIKHIMNYHNQANSRLPEDPDDKTIRRRVTPL